METKQPLRIGTRKSPLAMVQTQMVCDALKKSYDHLNKDGAIEIVQIETLGDTTQKDNLSLEAHGGKALWASEHEQALRTKQIDIAVHSAKDMPGELPDDMVMPCFLPRADARDVFLSPKASHFMDLPKGATIGTSSPRRAAIVLSKRPDLKIEVFRGNVETRLGKLADGVVDGTFLAFAGLDRREFKEHIKNVLSIEDMLPAVGQGAIGLEFIKSRDDLAEMLEAINCPETRLCVSTERAWLKAMDGSCRSPLAGYAEFVEGQMMRLRVFAAGADGLETRYDQIEGQIKSLEEGQDMGTVLGQDMKTALPDDFFEAV